MPIGRGIMQIGRFDIFPTSTTISSITPPTTSPCGTTVNFQATVNNLLSPVYPTGNVYLIDENDNIVGTSALTNGITMGESVSSNMPVVMIAGNHSYYIRYEGVLNVFAESTSATTLYSGTFINTSIYFPDLDIAAPPKFCYAHPFDVTVRVQPISGIIDPSGSVNFKLYYDNITSVNLPSATLVGQFATVTIPAFTTNAFITNTGTFYVQALYPGDNCFNPNQTLPGISVLSDIEAISNATTTTTIISPSSGHSFPTTSSQAFGITVTNTLISNPNSDGYVNLTGIQGMSNIFLGTDIPISGNANIIVPANTFTSTGAWSITANYFTDGYCYASSTSASISVTLT